MMLLIGGHPIEREGYPTAWRGRAAVDLVRITKLDHIGPRRGRKRPRLVSFGANDCRTICFAAMRARFDE